MDDQLGGDLLHDEQGSERVAFGPGAEGVARLRQHALADYEDEVEVTFSYRSEDLSAALWYYLRWGNRRRLASLFAVIALIGFLLLLVSGSFMPGLIYLGLSALLLRASYRSTASRMLARDNAWSQEHRWMISEDGLFVARPNAEGRLGWKAIDRVIESPDGFLVFPQSNLFHLLPKRCLTRQQIDRVRELMVLNCRYERPTR